MSHQSIIEEMGIRLTLLDPGKDADLLADFAGSHSIVRHHLDGIFKPFAVSEIKDIAKEDLNVEGDENSELYFAVHLVESGELIGLLRVGDITSSHQTAWINIDMANDEVFSTRAGDVLRLALRYGFAELDLYRVYVEIPSYNESEITLYEEAGFLRETQRRQAVYYNGAYYDDLLYGILRTEWIKAELEVTL